MDTFESVKNPIAGNVDILMHVGEDNYTVSKYVKESREQGMSKRIPLTAIPDGVEFGRSRLFVCHKKAIVQVGAETLDALADELVKASVLTQDERDVLEPQPPDVQRQSPLLPDNWLPAGMLSLVMALESLDDDARDALVERFAITYHPGVFGYGYISEIRYYCKPDDEELPEKLAHLDGYVTPAIAIHNGDEE